jgi:hypothetical protein
VLFCIAHHDNSYALRAFVPLSLSGRHPFRRSPTPSCPRAWHADGAGTNAFTRHELLMVIVSGCRCVHLCTHFNTPTRGGMQLESALCAPALSPSHHLPDRPTLARARVNEPSVLVWHRFGYVFIRCTCRGLHLWASFSPTQTSTQSTLRVSPTHTPHTNPHTPKPQQVSGPRSYLPPSTALVNTACAVVFIVVVVFTGVLVAMRACEVERTRWESVLRTAMGVGWVWMKEHSFQST